MNENATNQTEEKTDEVELSDEQSERIDEIDNAVFELCKILSENSELEWDMSFIGEIADYAASVLFDHNIPVRYPSIVTNEDNSQYIEEYFGGYKPKTTEE